jgi:putative transposase
VQPSTFQWRKTCKRYNTPGDAHALTFSCFGRQPLLSSDRSKEWFLRSLSAARTKHRFALWAYVLMPEHVHLVIFPEHDPYSISDILSAIKQPVTRQALKYVRAHAPDALPRMRDERAHGKVSHRFWQRGGGFDRNLVKPEAVHATIDYVHANPVRRGLVACPEDWAWSSARFFAGRTDVPLVPNIETLPLRPPHR